jgi:hypothetical protein
LNLLSGGNLWFSENFASRVVFVSFGLRLFVL